MYTASEVPEGYFDVTFLEMTHSRYSSKAVLRSGLSQECALSTSQLCSPDLNHEVEQSLIEVPLYRLFPENPLKMGFYLYSIGNGIITTYYISLNIINLVMQITQPTVFVMIIASRRKKSCTSHLCQVAIANVVLHHLKECNLSPADLVTIWLQDVHFGSGRVVMPHSMMVSHYWHLLLSMVSIQKRSTSGRGMVCQFLGSVLHSITVVTMEMYAAMPQPVVKQQRQILLSVRKCTPLNRYLHYSWVWPYNLMNLALKTHACQCNVKFGCNSAARSDNNNMVTRIVAGPPTPPSEF